MLHDQSVHVEQTKPTEERRFEFGDASGSGFRPDPPGFGRVPPGSSGPAPVRDHSHRQTVYGGTRPRQYTNRGPNEPPSSVMGHRMGQSGAIPWMRNKTKRTDQAIYKETLLKIDKVSYGLEDSPFFF